MSRKTTSWGCSLWIVSLVAIIWNANCADAQIIPDRTLPNNSRVTPSGNISIIEGGTQAGRNLFHSFQQFSIPTGSEAYFNNALDIQNIISRVTGGSISNIDGLIRANGTANLFFVNPNGIVFGSNASLNIGGSFVATTASALQFGNLGIFSASIPDAPSPLLTINPSALLFNQLPTGNIINRSQAPAGVNPNGSNTTGLRVPDGNSLLLVGGNVNLDGGRLRAFGGRIELAGLATPGSVGINVAGNTFSLSVPNEIQRADVSLTNLAAISAVGAGGGDIVINARNLEISNSYLFGGIGIGLGNVDTVAGNINLNATGAITLAQGSQVDNELYPNANGNGGNIIINAGSLTVQNGAELTSPVNGQGNGGNIIITARDRVDFDGKNSDNSSSAITSVQSGAVGKAGDIQVTAGTLSLTNGALFSSDILPKGNGDAGKITINVRDTVSLDGNSFVTSGVNLEGVGKGGDIRVTSGGSVSVTNGAQLNTDSNGQGNAGNITINARDTVNLDGVVGNAISGVQSDLLTSGAGKGGNIQITTGSLSVTNGAEVSTNTDGLGNAGNVTINARDTVTFNGVSVSDNGILLPSLGSSTVTNNGIGNGGDIRVTARALFLTNGGELNAIGLGQGNAGSITIDADDKVAFDGSASNGLRSGAQTFSASNGGDILVTTGMLSLTNGGNLSSFARGNAGNITINARDAISIDSISSNEGLSGVFSSLIPGGAGGKGGYIKVTTGSLSLTNGAQLNASTYGQGPAGSVFILAKDSVSLTGSNTDISSIVGSGGVGKGGDINIQAASLSLKDGAQLQSLVRQAANNQLPGRGDAGNVNVDVTGPVTIAGMNNGLSSGILSLVQPGAIGNGGNINLSSSSLSLTDGGRLNASTFGQGSAGSVFIRAIDSVSLTGSNTDIFSTVESGGVGKGGDINIDTASLSLKDGAQLQSLVRQAANNQLPGRGDAGNINVDVTGPVTIAGMNNGLSSGILSLVQPGTIGNGGNINLSSSSLSLTDGGRLNASTFGQGNAGSVFVRGYNSISLVNGSIFSNSAGNGAAGNVEVQAASLRLDNKSIISAETVAGQGNIDLNARDFLLLRRGSDITTSATGTATGGNITINTNNLVAIPQEDSDIRANAQDSFGGRVTINASGVFGIQFQQRDTPLSDITASSSLGPQFSGTVTINTPDIEPGRGVLLLPTQIVDSSQHIVSSSCASFADVGGSKFIVTGRGGLPPSPEEPLTSDAVWSDTRLPEQHKLQTTTTKRLPKHKPESLAIIPATGWVFNSKGEVTLISEASNPTNFGSTPATCSK